MMNEYDQNNEEVKNTAEQQTTGQETVQSTAAESSQGSYGAPGAESSQSSYRAPGAESSQGSYGAPGAESSQGSYGAPGAGNSQGGYTGPAAGAPQGGYRGPAGGMNQGGYAGPGGPTARYTDPAYRSSDVNRIDMSHIPPEPNKKKKKGSLLSKVMIALLLGLVFGLFVGVGMYGVKLVTQNVSITHNGKELIPKVDDDKDSDQPGEPVPKLEPKDSDDKGDKDDQDAEEPKRLEDADAEDDSSDSDDGEIQSTGTSVTASVTDASGVVENCMPSIVAITEKYTQTYQSIWGQQFQNESSANGSGVIIGENDDELLIVTNNHVVSDAEELTVQFCDDETYDALVKGTDVSSDLAIVAVKKSDLSADTKKAIRIAVLGDSDDLKAGEPAIAIGNAMGYGQSVTVGVISALDRTFPSEDGTTHAVLQTDAAINPGNSGGALFNSKGELIGINEAKIATTSVEGVGYAIPISVAKPIMDELMEGETREKADSDNPAYLGIGGVDVTSDIAQTYDMPTGVYINQVMEGYGAEDAGLERGDIITKLGNKSVMTMEELRNELEYYNPGDEVEVTIMRADDDGYQEYTATVTLSERPTDDQ